MSDSDGVVDEIALLLFLLEFALLTVDISSPELASLMTMFILHLSIASSSDPVAWSEEQAWSLTCSSLRLPDDDVEGTRVIPSTPGLGLPKSPVPVVFFLVVLSMVV